MSIGNLTENARAYRNDLRGELNAIYNSNRTVYQGREAEGPIVLPGSDIGVRLPEEAQCRLNALSCRMPWQVFDDLVEHDRCFGRISRIADENRVLSGVDHLRDNSWPFCRDCRLPFVTMLNGHPRHGYWVCRIEDGEELCEACWLAEHYGGDRARMIEHVIASDMGDDSRWIRAQMRREHWEPTPGMEGTAGARHWTDYVGTAVMHIERSYWQSPGLRELIRLHRVSLVECAETIVRMIKELVKRVRREDRERNSSVSNRLNFGTRESVYV